MCFGGHGGGEQGFSGGTQTGGYCVQGSQGVVASELESDSWRNHRCDPHRLAGARGHPETNPIEANVFLTAVEVPGGVS